MELGFIYKNLKISKNDNYNIIYKSGPSKVLNNTSRKFYKIIKPTSKQEHLIQSK